jgi:hypothetical protein
MMPQRTALLRFFGTSTPQWSAVRASRLPYEAAAPWLVATGTARTRDASVKGHLPFHALPA